MSQRGPLQHTSPTVIRRTRIAIPMFETAVGKALGGDVVNDILSSAAAAEARGGLDMTDDERLRHAISRLDEVRTDTIRDLLLATVDTIRSGDMDAQLECSLSLSRLLSEQLVSGQEIGLYQVCRVAWDHAHVGESLKQTLQELDRVTVAHLWDARMKEIEQGLDCAENGGGSGYRALVQCVEDIRRDIYPRLDEGSTRGVDLERVEERLRLVVKQGLLDRIGFHGGMPVEVSRHGGESIGVLWECCSMVGIVDDVAKYVSDMVYDSCLRPVMTARRMADGSSYPVGYREKVIYKIIKGVADTVAGGDGLIISALGRYLWNLVANAYTDAMGGDGLGNWKQMMFAKKLEAKAAMLGFLCEGEKGPIAVATTEYIKKELIKRRAATVTQIRDALIVPIQEQNVVSFGENELYVPWGHSIGADVLQRLSVVGNYCGTFMEEDVFQEMRADTIDIPLGVCESPTSILESYRTTVQYIIDALGSTTDLPDGHYLHFMSTMLDDVAALLVALVDFVMQKEHVVAYHVALIHMSCMYMCRCFSLLVFRGKPACIDMNHGGHLAAEKVRRLGENVLKSMLASHEAEMEQDVLHLSSWRQQEDVQDIIRRKKSVQKLRHGFRRLGASLSGHDIPDTLFFKVVATLAEALLRPILDSILQLQDISEDLSENIPRVLEDLVSQCDEALQGDHGLLGCAVCGKFGDGVDHSEMIKILLERTPVVKKLSEVCQVMPLTSRDIVDRWNQGTLSSFSRDELIALIQALFEDTPQVRSSLSMIH